MRETLLDKVKVGDRVVYAEIPYRDVSRYSFATVEKRNEKSIVVNGKRFYKREAYGYAYDNWVAKKESYSSYSYNILPDTPQNQARVKETEAMDARRAHESANKTLEEASEKAEMEAFLATDEGKAFTALKEEWVGAKIAVVPRGINEQGRSIDIYVYEPLKPKSKQTAWENRIVEIEIRQYTKSYWTDEFRFNYLKRPEIRGYSSFGNPKQAEKYMEAFQKAIEIANLWDADTGKKWDGDALVAVEPPCPIDDTKGW